LLSRLARVVDPPDETGRGGDPRSAI